MGNIKNLILIVIFAGISHFVYAQNDEVRYVNANELMILGQGFDNPQVDYGRLPAGMEFRKDLTRLATNSAGLAVRFATNSKSISFKWTVRHNRPMDHMPLTGIRGLDIYRLDKKQKWIYVGTARVNGNGPNYTAVVSRNLPEEKKEALKNATKGPNDAAVVSRNLPEDMNEYIAYLPLYDGLLSLEIGIAAIAVIEKPEKANLTKSKDAKPIVFYGTSITQGGCASRPGMAYPAILGRMLNRETVNLGFSANGRLDFSMAKAIAMIDAEAVVVDCLWNCTRQTVIDSAYRFISHIAKAKPQMKIFMLETLKCTEWETAYKQLVKDGYKNIVYVKSADFIGTDGESTVDGCHYTDLGFYRFANAFYPFLKKFKI